MRLWCHLRVHVTVSPLTRTAPVSYTRTLKHTITMLLQCLFSYLENHRRLLHAFPVLPLVLLVHVDLPQRAGWVKTDGEVVPKFVLEIRPGRRT